MALLATFMFRTLLAPKLLNIVLTLIQFIITGKKARLSEK
ncbi:hypothetical protein STRCR_1383 [Streptococcus criceti HS-6]|uniref:Uncharacterized protein n=1 Tax=Streptococcus criceti HS-6 TaxID=873449 RepID=G5JN48_STRCG|nr:hypothetical protein STRCR_1383 [Streptococcus criceti HS-6]